MLQPNKHTGDQPNKPDNAPLFCVSTLIALTLLVALIIVLFDIHSDNASTLLNACLKFAEFALFVLFNRLNMKRKK